MKKLLYMIMVFSLLLVIAAPVAATEVDFVPSITDKGAPTLVPVGENDAGETIYGYAVDADGNILHEVIESCIIVTPVSQVDDSEEIPDDAADQLKATFSFLRKNPNFFGENKVVRDLFDVSVHCGELEDILEPMGNILTLTFDLGIAADEALDVQLYKNDNWMHADKIVNNGDGTVSVTFEHFCPVAFIVNKGDDIPVNPPKTGDDSQLILWAAIGSTALLLMIVLIVLQYRSKKHKDFA